MMCVAWRASIVAGRSTANRLINVTKNDGSMYVIIHVNLGCQHNTILCLECDEEGWLRASHYLGTVTMGLASPAMADGSGTPQWHGHGGGKLAPRLGDMLLPQL